jgi:hypothetical protein
MQELACLAKLVVSLLFNSEVDPDLRRPSQSLEFCGGLARLAQPVDTLITFPRGLGSASDVHRYGTTPD